LPVKSLVEVLNQHSGLAISRVRYSRSVWEIELSDEVARRVSYYVDVERKVITLTTFGKQRDNERREIERARKAMSRHQTDEEER